LCCRDKDKMAQRQPQVDFKEWVEEHGTPADLQSLLKHRVLSLRTLLLLRPKDMETPLGLTTTLREAIVALQKEKNVWRNNGCNLCGKDGQDILCLYCDQPTNWTEYQTAKLPEALKHNPPLATHIATKFLERSLDWNDPDNKRLFIATYINTPPIKFVGRCIGRCET